jgi:hypothetical protein
MHTPEEIKKALQDGIDAGKHDSTPGNLFRTAWPAARDYGYHGILHDIFTQGYLSELPAGGVLVDSNGRTKEDPEQPVTLLTVEQGGHVSTLDVPADCALTPTNSPATAFDYRHQAWVVNGVYERCSHLAPCDCYGRKHAGELPAADADIH